MTAAAGQTLFTNTSRILWPDDGYTKGDLIAYNHEVACWLLPHVAGRPLTLQRFPSGIDGPSFFEKNVPRGAPPWIKTVTLPSGGRHDETRYVVCDDEATLLYLANLAAITLHVWTSRVGSLDEPDFVFFDLDPGDDAKLRTLARVAVALKGALDSLGVASLVKTSGGTGLHVIVPIAKAPPRATYDDAKRFAKLLAHHIALECGDEVTLQRSIAKRPRTAVYFDWAQVGKGKTLVPPYAVRARPGAPVSMPIAWADVALLARNTTKTVDEIAARFTIENVPTMLRMHGDPWAKIYEKKQHLLPALLRAQQRWEA